MNRLAALALLLTAFAFGQDLHFKTRTLRPPPSLPGNGPPGGQQRAGHQIVQFDHSPGVEDLDGLLKGGMQVIGALPDNAVVVAGGPAGSGIGPRPGIRWIGVLDPADKLSPDLGTHEQLAAVIEFHGDVPAGVQDAIAAAEGVTLLRPVVLVANHAIVNGSLDDLTRLAAHDEVAYIFPADPALLTDGDLIPCAGMLTQSGPVPQYANIVHGWDLDADHAAHLNYVFGSLTPRVPAAAVQAEIIRAFNEWSKNANVTFQPGNNASAPRTVLVKFVSGAHGDAYPFDGYGSILAHTFYPVPVNAESIAGDMHLNADENWHMGADVDIYSVALHEVGHAIGLGHSDKPGDVMYPYYHRGMALSANDIGGAQSLYGLAGASPAAPVTGPASGSGNGGTTGGTTGGTNGGTTGSTSAPLRLTLDSVAATTQAPQLTITGVLSGGAGPFAVQWQTDHGYSGQASLASSGAWTGTGVSLVNGSNTLTVTAFDSAHRTASQTASVARLQTPATGTSGSAPVSVAITSPPSAVVTVNTAALSVSGTASGGSGITRVTWQTSTGSSGVATGAEHWLAANIPVMTGTTTIVIRAWDGNGANAWAALVAVRY